MSLPIPFASRAVIEFWRQRFKSLNQALHHTPHAEAAWFWTVQRRVIGYLLSRYDQVSDKGVLPSSDSASAPSASTPSHRVLEFCSARSLVNLASAPLQPRNSQSVQPVVQEISQCNLERYDLLRREWEAELTRRRQTLKAIGAVAKVSIARSALYQDEPPFLYVDLRIDESVEKMFRDYSSDA